MPPSLPWWTSRARITPAGADRLPGVSAARLFACAAALEPPRRSSRRGAHRGARFPPFFTPVSCPAPHPANSGISHQNKGLTKINDLALFFGGRGKKIRIAVI
ncbi:hypothetical protein [Burkholderia glumae]|uniref:hypothetical protein n=1 Tax=Burkholderia glumae TaxID=337 RepID=UPI0021507102|nr:hypothetical protein [Burkholderia glumae]